jgi:hypothetical protein
MKITKPVLTLYDIAGYVYDSHEIPLPLEPAGEDHGNDAKQSNRDYNL